jgi:hypothetical protein
MYQETKELAYLIGVYLGDGSTTIKLDKKKGNTYRFQLGSVDLEFVDKVEEYLKTLGLHSTRNTYKNSNRNPKWNDMYFLTVSSKDFVFYLREQTENKVKIPKWIYKSEENEINFVNGVLDSEGFMTKSKVPYGSGFRYQVGVCVTAEWIYDVIPILKKYGVSVCNECKRILPSGKTSRLFQFNIISFSKSPFKFCIKRKLVRLEEYLKNLIVRDSEYYSKLGMKGAKARWSR